MPAQPASSGYAGGSSSRGGDATARVADGAHERPLRIPPRSCHAPAHWRQRGPERRALGRGRADDAGKGRSLQDVARLGAWVPGDKRTPSIRSWSATAASRAKSKFAAAWLPRSAMNSPTSTVLAATIAPTPAALESRRLGPQYDQLRLERPKQLARMTTCPAVLIARHLHSRA